MQKLHHIDQLAGLEVAILHQLLYDLSCGHVSSLGCLKQQHIRINCDAGSLLWICRSLGVLRQLADASTLHGSNEPKHAL